MKTGTRVEAPDGATSERYSSGYSYNGSTHYGRRRRGDDDGGDAAENKVVEA